LPAEAYLLARLDPAWHFDFDRFDFVVPLKLELHLSSFQHRAQWDFDFGGDVMAAGYRGPTRSRAASSEMTKEVSEIDGTRSSATEDIAKIEPRTG
jgi:hypothetical protein